MNQSSLPDLSYKDLIKALRHFSLELREKGPILVGKNCLGQPFTVHQHPSQKCYNAKLSRILKSLAVSRDEFWNWYHNIR